MFEMWLFATPALRFQGLAGALSSPASRDAVKVGPSTHPLPGEAGLRVGLEEFEARQRQGPGTTCCPCKWHRSSVKTMFSYQGLLLGKSFLHTDM